MQILQAKTDSHWVNHPMEQQLRIIALVQNYNKPWGTRIYHFCCPGYDRQHLWIRLLLLLLESWDLVPLHVYILRRIILVLYHHQLRYPLPHRPPMPQLLMENLHHFNPIRIPFPRHRCPVSNNAIPFDPSPWLRKNPSQGGLTLYRHPMPKRESPQTTMTLF